MRQTNFNTDRLIDGRISDGRLENRSGSFGKNEVLFDNIEDALVREIQQADAVFGVIAWLTSDRLLYELAQKDRVSIIVQKEDFLRPDITSNTNAKRRGQLLRPLYDRIAGCVRSCDENHNYVCMPSPIDAMSVSHYDENIAAIRCAGVVNQWARIHHKFAVFCRTETIASDPYPQWDHRPGEKYFLQTEEQAGRPPDRYITPDPGMEYVPYAVATGSYNWTHNARQSRENIVIIRDQEAAQMYFEEWAQVCAISEPLDWDYKYVQPEWRIGT